MSYEHTKLAISGGLLSRPLMDSVFELAETQHPQMVVDTTPLTNAEKYASTREYWTRSCAALGMPEPTWLQETHDDDISYDRTAGLLETADVLMITGGGTRHAYEKWQRAEITSLMVDKVRDGEIVATGASAGALMWFEKSYTDSDQYDAPEEESWEYAIVDTAGLFPSWATPHYSDHDKFGRLRSDGFSKTLADHDGQWSTAVGIDTHAALICRQGVVTVKDIGGELDPPNRALHIFQIQDNAHLVLKNGDSIDLDSLR